MHTSGLTSHLQNGSAFAFSSFTEYNFGFMNIQCITLNIVSLNVNGLILPF